MCSYRVRNKNEQSQKIQNVESRAKCVSGVMNSILKGTKLLFWAQT